MLNTLKVFLSRWHFFFWEFSVQIHNLLIDWVVSWFLKSILILMIHQMYSWQTLSPASWASYSLTYFSFAIQEVLNFMRTHLSIGSLISGRVGFYSESSLFHLYLVGYCLCFLLPVQHLITFSDSTVVDFCSWYRHGSNFILLPVDIQLSQDIFPVVSQAHTF